MLNLFDRAGNILNTLPLGFRLGSRTIITTTGTSTYTVPSSCDLIMIECIGGGGGGQPVNNSTAGNARQGNGGQSGGYATSTVGVIPRQVLTAVVNAGGPSNTNGGVTSLANAGGTILCAAAGGQCALNGNADGATELFMTPSSIPQGTAVGDFTVTGNVNAPPAHRVSGTVIIGGKGAAGPFGGRPVNIMAQGNGAAGGRFGAGGTGAISVNAGGATTGGAGGQGVIIIWEFYD